MNLDAVKIKVTEAVRYAGTILSTAAMEECAVTQKGIANFVTEVDFRVQSYLAGELQKIIPGSNMISEESEQNRFSLEQPTWILDPVDGTTNLMYGYRHSAVSLALYVEQKPALAWVYNPFMGEMFMGEPGKGALLNGGPICTGTGKMLKDTVITFGTTPYDRSTTEKSFDILRKVYDSCRDIRRSGSAALDLAYVACGRVDGFFELCLQPWDFAAGMIILREAGGKLSRWDGSDANVLKAGNVLATNGWIHEEMLKLF